MINIFIVLFGFKFIYWVWIVEFDLIGIKLVMFFKESKFFFFNFFFCVCKEFLIYKIIFKGLFNKLLLFFDVNILLFWFNIFICKFFKWFFYLLVLEIGIGLFKILDFVLILIVKRVGVFNLIFWL